MGFGGISGDLIKDEKGGELLNVGGRDCVVQVLYLVYTVHQVQHLYNTLLFSSSSLVSLPFFVMLIRLPENYTEDQIVTKLTS